MLDSPPRAQGGPVTFRFRTLGGASLEGPKGPVTGRGTQPRRLAVLSLLAAAPDRTLLRDRIVGCVWPEAEQSRARHLLSDAVYVLRRTLGEEALLSRGNEALRLDEHVVWTDVGAFEAALEAGDLETAVDHYDGEFLAGFHLSGAPDFERWQERQRRRLGSLYGEALERLARKAEDDGDAKAAVRWWKKRAAHDPFDSRIAHALMSALAAAGNPAGALRHARVHELMLRDELGLEPADEVLKLADTLREGGDRDTSEASRPIAVADGRTCDERGEAVAELVDVGRDTVADGIRTDDTFRRATESSPGHGRRIWWGIAATIALALLGFVALVGEPEATARDPIRLVLADFTDRTAEASLGPVVTEAVRIDLAQSRRVSLAEPGLVGAVLERMERDPGAPLIPSAAREVALREGLDAVVSGEIHPAGEGYLLTAAVTTPDASETLAATRATANGDDTLIAAVDDLAKNLREEIGEPANSLRAAVPLERATTRSLEALKRYSRAVRLGDRGGRFETVTDLLEEAVTLDSTFALAYRALSEYLGYFVRDPAGRAEMARKAYEHRAGLPDRERWLVEGWHHYAVTRDAGKAVAAFESLADAHPLAPDPLTYLGYLHARFGRWEEAARYHSRRIEVDSLSSWNPYWNLAVAQHKLGLYADSRRTIDLLERRFGRLGTETDRLRMWVAAGERDFDRAIQLARRITSAAEDPYDRYYNARYLAYNLAAVGRLREADAALKEAATSATRDGRPFHVVGATLQAASVRLRIAGDTADALRRLDDIRRDHPQGSLEPSEREYPWLARLYADAGLPTVARRVLAEAETAGDVAGDDRSEALRVAEAHLARAEGDPGTAIELVRPLVRRLPPGSSCTTNVACPLYPLGRAYEATAMPDSAIAIYERFVHAPHTALYWDVFYRTEILERLAALYAERGEIEEADSVYGLLVDQWANADPELRTRLEGARVRPLTLGGDSESMRGPASRP